MLTGHFQDRDGTTVRFTACEDVAKKIDAERVLAPRMLSGDEVNLRGRLLSAILSERGAMSKQSKERIAGLFSDMVCCVVALKNGATEAT